MGFYHGQGGSVTMTTTSYAWKANVTRWEAEDRFIRKAIKVMGQPGTGRVTGARDWEARIDFEVTDDLATDDLEVKSGDIVLTLFYNTTGLDKFRMTGKCVEISTSSDVDGSVTGSAVIRANGTNMAHTVTGA